MPITREAAEEIIEQYEDASGEQREQLLINLAQKLGLPIEELRESLNPANGHRYLVERLLVFEAGNVKRTREELLLLIEGMMRGGASEAQIDEWLRILTKNVPAPFGYITDLIYHTQPELLPEQILDLAMAYKPKVHHL